MKTPLHRDNLAFTGVQWFLWSGFAVYFGFFVPYLKSSGYNEVNIGTLMAVLSFVGIIGPIFWGAMSDRLRSAKGILAFNLIAGGAAALLIPLAVKTYGWLLAILITVNFTICAMPSVVDGWVMRLKSRGSNVNYGLIRGAGSLAYAAANMVCGLLFDRFGLGLMFPIFFGFGCATACIVLLIREKPPEKDLSAGMGTADAEGKGSPSLVKNQAYLIFVGLSTLLYVGQCASMSFYPVLLQQAGGGSADLGLALGIMALSEFPVMFLSSRLLGKFRDTTLLLASMAFFTLRLFLFFSLHSVQGLVWAQITNSLSFGIFMPASVHFISRISPGQLRTTALSVATSAYMGVGGILGNFLGGIAISSLGIRTMFAMASGVVLAVTVLFSLVLVFRKQHFEQPG